MTLSSVWERFRNLCTALGGLGEEDLLLLALAETEAEVAAAEEHARVERLRASALRHRLRIVRQHRARAQEEVALKKKGS